MRHRELPDKGYPQWHSVILQCLPPRATIRRAVAGLAIVVLTPALTINVSASPVLGQLVDDINLRGIEDVHIEGDLVYLPCREGKRLTLCSIANPTAPVIRSTFSHPDLGPVAGFALHNDVAYLTSQSNGKLLILDVSNPEAFHLLGSIPIGDGPLYKVAYQDGHCYVADQGGKRLVVVKVTNPQQPAIVSTIAVTTEDDGPFSVTLRGTVALVGTIFGQRNSLAVVDINDPTSPTPIGHLYGDLMGHFSGDIVGNTFFAVNWDKNAFFVVDISNPRKPIAIAQIADPRFGNPNRCVVANDRAYLPMVSGDGIAVVDTSDPKKPRFLTAFSHPTLKKTYGAAVYGDLLVVGAREGNSLTILDRKGLEEIPLPIAKK